jgi:hypothetical protein
MSVIRRSALVVSLLLVAAGLVACGSSRPYGADPPTSGRFFSQTGAEMARPPLTHCPKDVPPELPRSSPGAKGAVVEGKPSAAVVCRWAVEEDGKFTRTEATVRGRSLARVVAVLNSLPPGLDGEFECESGINLWYRIGFRYADGSGTVVEANYGACGAVVTHGRFWSIGGRVRDSLDRAIGPDALLDGA